MSTVRKIYKNIVFLSSAEFISKILQFVLMVSAARLLDKASFGKFSFALSLSFIAVIIADLGINTLLIREIARDKNKVDKYFINALFVKVLFAIITYISVFIVINLLGYPKDTRYVVYMVLVFIIFSTFTDLFYSIFRAFERMIFDSIIKIVRMIILTAIGMYVLFYYHNVLLFSLTFIFVEVVVLILAYLIALKRFIKLKSEISLEFMKGIIKKALPFGLGFVFSSIYFYIDSVMLSKMRGDLEVAVYSASYNLALAILFIPTVYMNALYPVMSRYFKTSKENLIFIYKKSFKYLYIIGLPISVGIYFLADRIIVFFYGKQYTGSIIALQIISWFLFIKFLNFLTGFTLSSINKQNKRMLSQGSTAIFNVAANLVLIPKMGYAGAAIANFITEIFLFILYYWYVSKFLYAYNFLPILIKPIIASAIMVAFIKYANLGLGFSILLSSLVYFGMIILLKTFEKDDYGVINKIFKKSDAKKTVYE